MDNYTEKEYALFKKIVEAYKAKGYDNLTRLANDNFTDTESPTQGMQVGISVFYDDKKNGDVRVSFAFYKDPKNIHWWTFWKAIAKSVVREDFIMSRDGALIRE